MDTNVYSLVQSQRATAVVVTECVWGKTEHARSKKCLYNVWLDQTEWSRNMCIQNVSFLINLNLSLQIHSGASSVQVCRISDAGENDPDGDRRWQALFKIGSVISCSFGMRVLHSQVLGTQCRGTQKVNTQKYSCDPNTGHVRYSNGPNLFRCQMVRFSNVIWKLDSLTIWKVNKWLGL